MIEQIFVMQSSGITLYQWDAQAEENESPDTDNQLVAGFLTALNMFAESHKKQAIKELTLKETTFLFERENDLIFVMTTFNDDIIPVGKLILDDIKRTFLEVFPIDSTPMNGNVSIFRNFTQNLMIILKSYNLFKLIQSEEQIQSDDEIRTNILLDRVKGEILFIHAKEYLDRKLFSFHTEMITRAANRLIEDKINDDIQEIIALSKKSNRSIHLHIDKKTILISEYQNSQSDISLLPILSEKQVKKLIRSPGKLKFDYYNDFFIVDEKAEFTLTNIKEKDILNKEPGVELLAIRTSFDNIFQQIYKDNLFATVIVGIKKIYIVLPLVKNCALLFINPNQCVDIPQMISNSAIFRMGGEISDSNDQVNCIFNEIKKFIKKF